MLTTTELFNLGVAYGSFSLGDIDQGVHCILPGTDHTTGEETNLVFYDICDSFLQIKDEEKNTAYLNAIITWANKHNIDIGITTLF